MAIEQDEATFIEMAHKVGITDPRASEIYNVADVIDVWTRDMLAEELNFAGYYDEKADHLVEAGVTFV